MCGIAGFAGHGTETELNKMVSTITHRGPDFQRVCLRDNVGLAHARLSIIDLSTAGNQPMFNQDRSIGIVYNGEIYNFLEIRDKLLSLNKYTFSSKTDTEVLLYLYEEYGENMFQEINGMFAFAIFDFRNNQLLLARDRMGKKPLYYGIFNSTLIFASEVKAILQHPLVPKEINLDALNQYLTHEYVPTPLSIFKNIYKLEPATCLVWKDKRILSNKPFWNLKYETKPISFPDAINKFDELLNNAVASRLISDVPLGVFLSGGLDSSTIAYYAQKNHTGKIKTFSIGFEESSYDETEYIKKVSDYLGTENYHEVLTAQDSLKLIPEIADLMDEPFADPSIIPTYLLSKHARSQVTVSLGGDGSDELMAGYPTFLSDYLINYFYKCPGFVKNALSKAAELLPVTDNYFSFDFKTKQFLRGFESRKEYIHSLWLGSFSPREKKRLFTDRVYSQLINPDHLNVIDKRLEEVSQYNSFQQLIHAYCRTYLLDDILTKVDRASMFTSLEVRAPLLDYQVVEFLNHLPKKYKLNGFKGKYILKELMKNRLPEDVVFRSKKGFGVPISFWLKNDLKDLMNELFSESLLAKHQLFNIDYIKQIKNDHLSQKCNNRKLLWTLMVFQLWHQKWFN